MCSVLPFSFDVVELCVVTINEKTWTRARDVCKALEYCKATKATDVVRHLCSKTNYAHKWQLTEFVSEKNLWIGQKIRKNPIFTSTSKEGMRFSSQQPKAKDFRKHCCYVLFPHVRQQLTSKMKEDHQQAIEEKDAAIPFLSDDLMIMWHCNHKGMYIRTSSKNVKTSLPILEHVM